MSEGTVPLDMEGCMQHRELLRQELLAVYARIAKFKREFDRYAKRRYSDAHVLAPAVDALVTGSENTSKVGDT